MSHVQDRLWEYALGQAPELAEHVEQCADCGEALKAVRQAQQAVRLASAAPAPEVDWNRVTDRLHAGMRERSWFARLFELPAWQWAMVAAAAVIVVAITRAQVPAELATLEAQREVEVVRGAEAATDTALVAGDEVRTAEAGAALVKLPDQSRMRVFGASRVRLTRSSSREVVLALDAGRIAVQASHRERRAFQVQAKGATVEVVGTVFSVDATRPEGLEVAVEEGRVRVVADGKETFVSAGEQRVIGAAAVTAIGEQERQEFEAMRRGGIDEPVTPAPPGPVSDTASGPPSAPAELPVEGAPAIAAGGLNASSAPVFEVPANRSTAASPTQNTGAPVVPPTRTVAASSTKNSGAPIVSPTRTVAAAPDVRPAPTTSAKRSGSQPVIAALQPSSTSAPADEPQQVVAMSPPTDTSTAPEPPLVEPPLIPADDEETSQPPAIASVWTFSETQRFFRRAEKALLQLRCGKYQPGLLQIATDGPDDASKAKARLLRARCFAASLQLLESINEYRAYSTEHPDGADIAEARNALLAVPPGLP